MYNPETVEKMEKFLRKIKVSQFGTSGKVKKHKKENKEEYVWLNLWEKGEKEKGYKEFCKFEFKEIVNLYVKDENGEYVQKIPRDKKLKFIKHYFLTINTIRKKIPPELLLEILGYDISGLVQSYYIGKIFTYFKPEDPRYSILINFLTFPEIVKFLLKPRESYSKIISLKSDHLYKYFKSKLDLIVIYANAKEFQTKDDRVIDMFKENTKLSPSWQTKIFIPYNHYINLFYFIEKIMGRGVDYIKNKSDLNKIINFINDVKNGKKFEVWELSMLRSMGRENIYKNRKKHKYLDILLKRIRNFENVLPYIHSKYYRQDDLERFCENKDKNLLNKYIVSLCSIKNLSRFYKFYFTTHVIVPMLYFPDWIFRIKSDQHASFYSITFKLEDILEVTKTDIDLHIGLKKNFENDNHFFGFINELPNDVWEIIWKKHFKDTFMYLKKLPEAIRSGNTPYIPYDDLLKKQEIELEILFGRYKKRFEYGMDMSKLDLHPSYLIQTSLYGNQGVEVGYKTITKVIKKSFMNDEIKPNRFIRTLMRKKNMMLRDGYIKNLGSRRWKTIIKDYYYFGSEKQEEFFEETLFEEWDKSIV